MMTPATLIRLALKTAGVEGIGQTPSAEDSNDVFTVLNAMVAQWSRKRWLIPNLIDIAVPSTGAQSYTIGIGGNIAVDRPDQIEAAYVRLLPITGSPVDLPLGIIAAHEDYASITMKSLQTLPEAVFYDAAFPLGNVYTYPVMPAGSYELHILIKNTIDQFTSLTQPIILPPEYADALIWNLAARIAPMFGAETNPTVVGLAAMGLNTIRGANSQITVLPMPSGLPGSGAGRWAGHGIPHYGSTS
jgi:hypothetical protein